MNKTCFIRAMHAHNPQIIFCFLKEAFLAEIDLTSTKSILNAFSFFNFLSGNILGAVKMTNIPNSDPSRIIERIF